MFYEPGIVFYFAWKKFKSYGKKISEHLRRFSYYKKHPSISIFNLFNFYFLFTKFALRQVGIQ